MDADVPLAYRMPAPSVDPDGLVYTFGGERATQGDDEFVLANIVLPRMNAPDAPFVWTCWMSITRAAAAKIDATWDDALRAHQAPIFAFVMNELPTYRPSTLLLRARIHQLPPGSRPEVELEATDHPLAAA